MATYFGLWTQTAEQLHDADLSTTSGKRLFDSNVRAYDCFRRLAVQYGMTALARTSLDLRPPDNGDDADFA
jgi:hypothetical protein